MKLNISLILIFVLINLINNNLLELSYRPQTANVPDEKSRDETIFHNLNTKIIRMNRYWVYSVINIKYNDVDLKDTDYIQHTDKYVPGFQIEFHKSGEYELNLLILSNSCDIFKECRKREKHIFNVKLEKIYELRINKEVIEDNNNKGSIAAIIFFILIIIIVLTTVYIIFNIKKIKKWWYRNSSDQTKAYLPNLENNPNNYGNSNNIELS